MRELTVAGTVSKNLEQEERTGYIYGLDASCMKRELLLDAGLEEEVQWYVSSDKEGRKRVSFKNRSNGVV